MSHLNPGLISAYNSLTDKHLAGYFSNARIRRHLQRAGLITRSGRIVPDKEYRHRLSQRQHQRHVRECLAQAIFHKVLEMERAHQIEIKQRLEEFAKRERVHKIKLQRSNRYEEDLVRVLSPRPPTGARLTRMQRSAPEGDRSESSESPGSSRPNTAPGKMQRLVRLKPIPSKPTTASLRRSSPSGPPNLSSENEQPLSCTMESRRRLTGLEAWRGVSPYCLPVINTFVTPVPPPANRKEPGLKVPPSSAHRGRRLRLSTLGAAHEDPPMLRSSVHQSRASVNMIYFGKKVHLSHDLHDPRDEVKVFQQHCGGENLCVYKGLLHKGETFQFVSRRHRGYPFSLTFFLNGLQVERLSSCCEFKHRRASRLGGRHRHFGFRGVEGASPCYRCIIAMGLDKQPNPPPKKEDGGGQGIRISSTVPPGAQKARSGADDAIPETSRLDEAETQVREETAAVEGKARGGYEEDFEADDEGPADDEDPADDACTQEKMSSSPQSQTTERNVSESEDDGNDGVTSHHSSCSSSSSSDREESEADTDIDRPKESDHEETGVPPEERAQADPEGASEVEPKSSEVRNSAEDSTDVPVSDSTGPWRTESNPNTHTEVEKTPHESKQEEGLERAKSVQEKLAEAVLKEPQYSSDPEPSDTSTEDEEDEQKGPEQDNNEEPVTGTEQETKCEEGPEVTSTVQDEEEMHGDGMKQKPEENTVASKDTAEETPAEDHPAEEAENTSLSAGPENKMEGKSSENRQDAAAKDVEQTDEVGREAKSSEEDESSVSAVDARAENETLAEDGAEAGRTTAAETEMKVELSDERQVLSCEEEPVADAEEEPREDAEDRAPRAEVLTGNWRGVLEESGGTAVETGGETSGDAPKAERDEQEEAAAGGEGEADESVQARGEVEEKAEDKDEEKQTDPNEMGDGDNSEERREEDNERKTGSSVGGNENEQNETADGKTEQPQKTNEGEDSECVKDGNEEEEKEATDVGEKRSEMCGKVEKNETDESRAEQTEAGEKNSGKCEKEEESGRASADELGRNTDADSAKDMKKTEGSTVEPEDEAANIEVAESVREASGEEKENGELDAENGEISSRAESVAQEDAEEDETEAQKDVKAKHTRDEIKTGDVTEEERADATDLTAESGEATENHQQTDPTPDAGSAKSDVKDKESDGDGPGTEIKETESCSFPEEGDEILIKEVSSARTFDVLVETSAAEDHLPSAVTDLSTTRGESGETDASKASEEGASVVLNPRASFPDKEEIPAMHPEITEVVDAGENVDLVSNWVTTHQVAKFFETFVEPLDDLKETQAEVSRHDQSADPLSSVKMVDDVGREQTKEEASEVEREGNVFQSSQTCEKDPSEDKDQVQEETEVMELMLENEPSDKELTKGLPAGSEGSRTSLQEAKDREGLVQNNSEQDRVSTVGVKDRPGSHHPVSRGSPEDQPEDQPEHQSEHQPEDQPEHQPEDQAEHQPEDQAEHQPEDQPEQEPELNHKPTAIIEFRAPSDTEHHGQRSTHPGEPSNLNGNQLGNAEEMWGASEEVIEAKLTWERRPEEPVESEPAAQDPSASGGKTDLQLIADLRHSKDRLSVSSLNDTHFARSSYPLLAAARPQNGQ